MGRGVGHISKSDIGFRQAGLKVFQTESDIMRQGQHKNRSRNRGRRPSSSVNRVYESNGPDVKVRGTAQTVADKYLQLARDAQSSGDIVKAESYFQHAEHYLRIVAANLPAGQPAQPQRRSPYDDDYDDGDETGGGDEAEQAQPSGAGREPAEREPERETAEAEVMEAKPAEPQPAATEVTTRTTVTAVGWTSARFPAP